MANRKSDNIHSLPLRVEKKNRFPSCWHMFIAAKNDDSVHPRSQWRATRLLDTGPVYRIIPWGQKLVCKSFYVYRASHGWWNRRTSLLWEYAFSNASARQYDIVRPHSYPLPIKRACDCGQWFINQVFCLQRTTDVCRHECSVSILCGWVYGRILTFLVGRTHMKNHAAPRGCAECRKCVLTRATDKDKTRKNKIIIIIIKHQQEQWQSIK